LSAGWEPDRYAERALRRGDAGDVVEMRVRQKDVRDGELVAADGVQQLIDLVARIDHDAFACVFTAEHETVLEEGLDGPTFENHRCSVLDARAEGLGPGPRAW
jgi:hypothetical protein